MDLSKHIDRVRDGIDSALSFADEDTKQVASRVASAAEPSLRLALIDAVTEAADEINSGLDESQVTVAFVDGDPRFVVQERPYEAVHLEDEPRDGEGEILDGIVDDELDDFEDEDADETLVRFSLRLPKWAKDKVDDRAEQRGMSTNAYLTEVIIGEIAGGRGPRGFGAGFGGGPGGPKGWGPGSFLGPDTADHIARVLSDVFGDDAARRGGRPRPGRPGGGRSRGDEGGGRPRGHHDGR